MSGSRRLLSCVAAVVVLVAAAHDARADEDEDAKARPPMPEPIFSETVTDIDGHEAGELEVEMNVSSLGARRGGAFVRQASIEAEWLATRRLGARLEPSIARSMEPGASSGRTDFGVSGGASWKLVHDYLHDFHLQLELGGRLPSDVERVTSPDDSALPASLDLRAGLRRGRFTLRGAVGAACCGESAHAPVRAAFAVLTPFASAPRFGFWGVELEMDATRRAPFIVALNLVPDVTPLRLPFRFGLAIPWAVGARATEPELGIFVRVFFESEREIAYGRGDEAVTDTR